MSESPQDLLAERQLAATIAGGLLAGADVMRDASTIAGAAEEGVKVFHAVLAVLQKERA